MSLEIIHTTGSVKKGGAARSLDEQIQRQERRYLQQTALWEERAEQKHPLTGAAFRSLMSEGTRLIHLLEKQVAATREEEKTIRGETQKLRADCSTAKADAIKLSAETRDIKAATERIKNLDPKSPEAQAIIKSYLDANSKEDELLTGRAQRLLASMGHSVDA